jgi:hypothetical protein
MKHISRAQVDRAMAPQAYNQLVQQCAKDGGTTGPVESPELIAYTKLNAARMRRLYKHWNPGTELVQSLKELKTPMYWICLTEAWCGDAAFYIPMLHKLTETVSHIELAFLLRDQNLELMDAFLTRGGRSIPKLILIQKENLKVLGSWGPRTQLAMEWRTRSLEQGLNGKELAEGLQRWYLEDEGRSFQQEFSVFLGTIKGMLSNQQ